MKLQADLIKCESGVLLFDINGFTPELETEKKYNVEIKDYKTSRSRSQNNKMWAIIQAIAKKTDNDEMQIYIGGLQHAKAKYTWLAGLPNIEKELLKSFRAVEIKGTVTTEDNKELVRYKCYFGSSKFDKDEMRILLDYFIGLAHAEGIRLEEEC